MKDRTEAVRSRGSSQSDELALPDDPLALREDTLRKSSYIFGFPRSIPYIVGNEFCERFCYYGLRAIATIYFAHFLGFGEDRATSLVHIWIVLSYLSPLGGAYISDCLWGKYKTIMRLSFVYAAGNAVLAVTAIRGVTGDPPHWWGAALGLLLIAMGTGGIKPCVSAFGGDQFVIPGEERLAERFFSLFYVAINSGSFLSSIITPSLRRSSGYGVAFGLPGVIMLVAIFFFWVGRRRYRRVPPTRANVLLEFVRVLRQRRHPKRATDTHIDPLDAAKVEHGGTFESDKVEDFRAVIDIMFVFIPIPIFWSLFDQQATRWVLQGQQMRPLDLGFVTLHGEEMNAANALLIVVLTPVFNAVLYPFLRKSGFKMRPLFRMGCGMLIAAGAFVVAAFVQIAVNDDPHNVTILWQLPQYVVITSGEIMVSITGLEFAYSQAPATMKSVIMSLWLTTVAIGNLLVAVVAELNPFGQVAEFFFFASLMVLAFLWFGWSTRSYTYRDALYREETAPVPASLAAADGAGAYGDDNDDAAVDDDTRPML